MRLQAERALKAQSEMCGEPMKTTVEMRGHFSTKTFGRGGNGFRMTDVGHQQGGDTAFPQDLQSRPADWYIFLILKQIGPFSYFMNMLIFSNVEK